MRWVAVTLVYANRPFAIPAKRVSYITEVHFRACQKNVHPLNCVFVEMIYSLILWRDPFSIFNTDPVPKHDGSVWGGHILEWKSILTKLQRGQSEFGIGVISWLKNPPNDNL